MRIILLTHELELDKPSNTGSLVLAHAPELVDRIVWQRTSPNEELVRLIGSNRALLLHPTGETNAASIEDYDNLIIIDSTWQQSRKIVNKSAYLKQAPMATLQTAEASTYKLRRNQPPGGLCTVECVIALLKMKGDMPLAEKLIQAYFAFNQR